MTPSINPAYQRLHEQLKPLRSRLLEHPVYSALAGIEDLRAFLSHHVFAVWDFMSLLKSLQRSLTCVDEVWLPHGDQTARRLINEIVLGEESDLIGERYTSHFELYLDAMCQVGCQAQDIKRLLTRVAAGIDVMDALDAAPSASANFSRTTFEIIRSRSLPAIAAAFTLGREDIIPDMFQALVSDLQQRGVANTSLLQGYLLRHIELDGDEHGPMAAHLLATVCGDDQAKWQEALEASQKCLAARLGLWDGVVAALPSRQQESA